MSKASFIEPGEPSANSVDIQRWVCLYRRIFNLQEEEIETMMAILQTDASYAFVVLRLGLALTFFAHGAQHVFGWFGGRGPSDIIGNWNKKRGIPVPLCILALFIELGGALAMLSGFLVRPAALGLAVFMALAMKEAHWKNGFFLNQGPGKGAGIEFCLALFTMSVAVLVGGAGPLSIDNLLSR